jgi:ribosomal protein S18 acetylase RimI-like enzyme
MSYEHSEHALTIVKCPAPADAELGLALRQAANDDIPTLSELFRDGFGNDGHVDPERLAGVRSRTMMITLDGSTVGTIALAREGDRGGIYGFVVAADHRGRGIGRQTLLRACSELFEAGATQVDLEVEVENDRALGLYTSIGFGPVATDDYYELVL